MKKISFKTLSKYCKFHKYYQDDTGNQNLCSIINRYAHICSVKHCPVWKKLKANITLKL